MLTGKRIVVTGGTGSLGRTLVERLLDGELGQPAAVTVFSRDEAKQHAMRLAFRHRETATDEVVFEPDVLRFRIGDVCDSGAVAGVLRDADVVFHAAALKQVPACEYHPFEAVKTNVIGAENLVRTIRDLRFPVETVVGVTTDKACKPVNVMGMTKALQERILARANLECDGTRFLTARYGNVLASRGSVIPLFHEQIAHGGPVTITTEQMTRFLLSLDDAVDTVLTALREGRPGETYVPYAPAARMTDVAAALIGERDVPVVVTGVRPGEKTHEILVSEEEAARTVRRGDYLAVGPILPELDGGPHDGDEPFAGSEYSSGDTLLDLDGVRELLDRHGLMLEHEPVFHA
ncbi:MAG TPA: polysaccharide biosynthesis protein [Conexibacter sp.]|jgi:UDP-glucose 4-epimerase|nr:polysaccharide biosynthesis protein [Conexibacter sp.]